MFTLISSAAEAIALMLADISSVAEGMEMMGASSVLYPKLYLSDLVLANVVVLILGFFASLSPAWRASRYEPVEDITKVG